MINLSTWRKLGSVLISKYAIAKNIGWSHNISCIKSSRLTINVFSARNMSQQKSITSFFKITPKKADIKEEKIEAAVENDSNSSSPVTNGKGRGAKRARSVSSESGLKSDASSATSSPDTSAKKKKVKRQRILSSSSESEAVSPVKTSPVKESPKQKSPSQSPVKLERKSAIKTYESPKTKKTKVKVEKSPLEEKTNKVQKKSPVKKEVKEETSPAAKKTDVKEKKNPFAKKENQVSVKKEKDDEDSGKVAESDYNPANPKYHPIKDACWLEGEDVPYLALAKTLEAIEATSARLKMVEILSNYFRSVIALTPQDLLPSVYLCLNQLAPAYHSLELGIAETYLMKAVALCTGRSLSHMRSAAARAGGVAGAAQAARGQQRTMFPAPHLRVRGVFAALKEIALMTGQASVNKKIAKIQTLYVATRLCEAKYLIRSLEGKLRIGLAEQSVLQALAQAVATTPPEVTPRELDASRGLSKDEFKAIVDETALLIKTTYCECPNYDAIVPVLLQCGVRGLPARCRLQPGAPLKPMLAHPTRGASEVFNRFENCEFTCEWKYDGERAQIHVPAITTNASDREGALSNEGALDNDKAQDEGAKETGPDLAKAAIFSRNQENNTSKYPDVLGRLPRLLKPSVTSCILDCEAVAYDTQNKKILPFQILSTRKRKDATESEIKVQVCVFVFDLLYLNGESLVKRPLIQRRELLREHFNTEEGVWQFATSRDCTNPDEMQVFLEESIKGSCEGLMVKALVGDNAKYDIARRSHNWLKLKKDYLDGVGDTIDVVVIGGYSGRGKRAGACGGFLLAVCAGGETFQSVCKIGTGFTEEQLNTFTEELDKRRVEKPPKYYSYDPSHTPDIWFAPHVVWEVRCADLSLSPSHRAAIGLVEPDKGISLRFPRFVRVREDKTPEDATSAQQLATMYLSQDMVKNQAPRQANLDDFY